MFSTLISLPCIENAVMREIAFFAARSSFAVGLGRDVGKLGSGSNLSKDSYGLRENRLKVALSQKVLKRFQFSQSLCRRLMYLVLSNAVQSVDKRANF